MIYFNIVIKGKNKIYMYYRKKWEKGNGYEIVNAINGMVIYRSGIYNGKRINYKYLNRL